MIVYLLARSDIICTYNFTIAGARRYWRMSEMGNPVNKIYTDYVDIYF